MISKTLKWTLTSTVIAIAITLVYNIVYYCTVVLIDDKSIASGLALTAIIIITTGFCIDLIIEIVKSIENKQNEVKELEPKQVAFKTVYPNAEDVGKDLHNRVFGDKDTPSTFVQNTKQKLSVKK